MPLEKLAQEKLSLCRRLRRNIQSINSSLELLEKEGQNAEQLAFHRLDADLAARTKLIDACARCEKRLETAKAKGEASSPEYERLCALLSDEGQKLAKLDSECTRRFESLRSDIMQKLRGSNQQLKSIKAYKLERSAYIAGTSSRFNVNV